MPFKYPNEQMTATFGKAVNFQFNFAVAQSIESVILEKRPLQRLIKRRVHRLLRKFSNLNHLFYSKVYEGGSICNENSPVYPEVLYLHTS